MRQKARLENALKTSCILKRIFQYTHYHYVIAMKNGGFKPPP